MKLDDLKPRLIIDRNNLDEELIQQADLFFSAAEQYALAVSALDEEKENLEKTDADLAITIRRDLEAKDDKVTEGRIKAEVLIHPRHTKITKNLIKLEYRKAKWQALQEAFRQRGQALKTVADLFVAGYFQPDSNTTGSKKAAEAGIRKQRTEAAKDYLDKQKRRKRSEPPFDE